MGFFINDVRKGGRLGLTRDSIFVELREEGDVKDRVYLVVGGELQFVHMRRYLL